MRYFMMGATFTALLFFTAPAFAAADERPGFWAGYLDGFLSVLKMIVSPFLDVAIVSAEFGPLAYTLGFYSGLLSFAGVAGALVAAGTSSKAALWG
jgi:hypothetical protein